MGTEYLFSPDSKGEVMKRTFGLILSAIILAGLSLTAQAQQTKKVLFLTKSSGFQHSVITRDPRNYDKLAWAEQILTDLGAKNGFEVTCTKDGSLFADPETYKKYDVFALYTTGDLTRDSVNAPKIGPDGKPTKEKDPARVEKGMGQEGYKMFIQSIADGKGYISFHCGADTFHSPGYNRGTGMDRFECSAEQTPYIQMVGGEFLIHQSQQNSNLKVVAKDFPGLEDLQDFGFVEEWYSLKNFQPDLHVILMQDTDSMTKKDRDGKKEWAYARPAFPETWARMDGKGRVFYTSMGHREDVWTNPIFQKVTAAGLNWVGGKTQFDLKPNIKEVAPGVDVVKK
jgi:type 1 glutamine amidotransferase